MSEMLRARTILAGCVTALALAACGGGGGDSPAPSAPPSGNAPPPGTTTPDPLTPAPPVAGAPALTGDIALDGRAWLNFRRSQVGMSTLSHSTVIDIAAQGHSEYQSINDIISHEQIAERDGRPVEGFIGRTLADRLAYAGYVFNTSAARAYGEVISAASNNSGQYMAEELITAVYHRFVIFEPVFKEIGTGAATSSTGRSYFTANFTANNGYGTGLARGQVAVWPFDAQTGVPRDFYSDTESPDPVRKIEKDGVTIRENLNRVGYPISVHANINAPVTVLTFTVRPRGGNDLATQLLSNATDEHTGRSSAAIIPLAPLVAGTTYDVTFAGTVDGTAVSRSWSFTTAR